MNGKGGMVVAGNTRYGRLIKTGQHTYEGERINAGGKFETRKFSGSERDVHTEWADWRQKGVNAATLHIEKVQARQAEKATKEEKVAETKKDAKKETMFVLSFQGRQKKDVALFDDMEAAMKYAEALEVALDATGMEGSYHVDELPVWGR